MCRLLLCVQVQFEWERPVRNMVKGSCIYCISSENDINDCYVLMNFPTVINARNALYISGPFVDESPLHVGV